MNIIDLVMVGFYYINYSYFSVPLNFDILHMHNMLKRDYYKFTTDTHIQILIMFPFAF